MPFPQILSIKLADCAPVHDPDYRTAWNDFTSFVEALSEKVSEADETIPELPVKDLVSALYPPKYCNIKLIQPDIPDIPR